MIEGPAVRRTLRLRLGDHLIRTCGTSEMDLLVSTVALLRTVFTDHFVDPDHHDCLFFHGCTIAGSPQHSHDFTVVHRGEFVHLSEFTFPWPGPSPLVISRREYARDVLAHAKSVWADGLQPHPRPVWQEEYVRDCWTTMNELTALTEQYLADADPNGTASRETFQIAYSATKRPLELLVTEVLTESEPFQPVEVQVRILFGPLRRHEVLPLSLNRGNLVLGTVSGFAPTGALLRLEGVGSGGISPGDALFGLQLYYP